MIWGIFFFVFNIIALISQYGRYQKLGNDAARSEEPEEIAALKSAQNKMIPNMILLVIGVVCLIGLFLYILSAH
jgi:hypothetical protein